MLERKALPPRWGPPEPDCGLKVDGMGSGVVASMSAPHPEFSWEEKWGKTNQGCTKMCFFFNVFNLVQGGSWER